VNFWLLLAVKAPNGLPGLDLSGHISDNNQIPWTIVFSLTLLTLLPAILLSMTPMVGQISGWDALDRGSEPVKTYMLRYAREKDLALFVSASMTARPATPQDVPMRVVVPAYILSELKAGFEIGAVLFLPFLLVDMVVASITTSIGMFQLPPVVISTPLKILLFVMVDGWNLLAGSLLKSF
jgi:flagellar biosynthetic protein FliP